MADYREVITFWFEEASPKQWFAKDPEFDNAVTQRFAELHARAARCELFPWRQAAAGRLAEIIVLDQFSRNMFRDRPQAFACDALALALAQEAVAHGVDQALPAKQRAFLYMPYMHSESAVIQARAVELFKAPGLEDNYKFALQHKAIIDRFGRYPHRNAILGRESSDEERTFLQSPGAGF